MVTHTQNCALHFIHPKWTYTVVNTHTHHEHTPGEVGRHLCCVARGAVGGSVPCSRAPRRGIEGGENAVHSLPHLQTLPDRDSNTQPFNYESNSLPLGHDYPLLCKKGLCKKQTSPLGILTVIPISQSGPALEIYSLPLQSRLTTRLSWAPLTLTNRNTSISLLTLSHKMSWHYY